MREAEEDLKRMRLAQAGKAVLVLSLFLLAGPILSLQIFPATAWSEDAESVAADDATVPSPELKDIEKSQKKSQKKLREINAPILPAASESAEERSRRREEAKERLEYFKRDVEKKREALAASGAPAPASRPSEKIPFLIPAVDKREAEALQREAKRREDLLAEKERLERELQKSEAKEERKARLAQEAKERRLEEARKKAEIARQKAEEKRKKDATAAQLKAQQEKLKLEEGRKKAETKRLADLAEAKRKEEAKNQAEQERVRRAQEKKSREIAEAQRKEELARQKTLEKKRQQEAAVKKKAEEEQKKIEAKKRAERERQARIAQETRAKEETRKREEAEKARRIEEKEARKRAEAKDREDRARQELVKKQKIEAERKQKKAEEAKRKLEERAKKEEAKQQAALKNKKPSRTGTKSAKSQAPTSETGRKAINNYLKQSQDLLDKGLYGPARVRLERVLKSDPDNVIAKNLMGLAVEGEFVAGQTRLQNEQQLARQIEEDTMRQKFLDTMDRIDREIREQTAEGNALYQKEDLVGANIRYRRVMALQAERQTITEGLIEKLKARQTESLDEGALSAAQAKRAKTELLMKDARRLESQEEWNKAAELYESVFTLDPLNSEASRGIDRMKKRFLVEQKKKDEAGGKKLDADLKGKVDFYLEQAEQAKNAGELDVAKVFAEQALTLDQGNRKARGILELIEKGK